MTVWNPATGGPSATSYYYSTDHLGSVRTLHSDTGTIVTDLDHDTYGNREVAVESVPQPFGFTGREYDRVTGLYHYRAREYDPSVGRFMQEDPLWFGAGDHNVYRYVWNNPTKFTDPSGMTAAVEYACLADFGFHAAVTVGGTGGLGLAGVMGDIVTGFGNGGGSMVGLVAAQQAAIVTFAASFQRCAPSRKPDTAAVSRTCPCKCGGKNSFGAGTLVLTKEGLVPIEDVRVGQLVGAWNPDTGGLRWQPVKARSMREAPSVMRLTVRDEAGRLETVVVTPNHPYLRPDGSFDLLKAVAMEPGGDWTSAANLRPSDQLASASGAPLEVVSSEVDLRPTQVYNLEVAGDHSFAVGELQAWVHNGFGAYVINLPNGQNYIGKGDMSRASQSAKNKGGSIGLVLCAKSDRESFIKEHILMTMYGGLSGGGLSNKRASPGKIMGGF